MTAPSPTRRRAAYRLGLHAESLAVLALRLKGYRILARRYRTPLGEIDLVARRGRVLAVVEVKARADLVQGIEAVSADARRRIGAAAELFLARHPALATCDIRFDLVIVRPMRWPYHVPNAF